MRETIEKLKEYIEENCVNGRDDFEISCIYNCIAVMYFTLEQIKIVERKNCEREDYEEI